MNNSITFEESGSSVASYRNYFLLFIIWPFLAFITAISNYRQREAKKIVFLFLIYFGLTFVVAQTGMDSYEYVRRFQHNATLPFSDFFKIVGGLYSSETSVDIIEPLISFIVSRFTNDYRLLFAAYAGLFAFFYLKSINLLYDRYSENPGWNSLIFMVFFITVIPITSINAPRMWIAAWAFFYGAYHVILFRDARFFFLTFGACFMHWSYILVNIVLAIYFFIGNRNYIYFPIVLLSFIFPNGLIPFFNWASGNSGAALQTRYSGYSSQDYNIAVMEDLQQTKWFVNLSNDIVFYYLLIVLIIIYFSRRYLMNSKVEKNLFSFLILFLAFVNFGSPFPDFARFKIIFLLFATLYIFQYLLKLPQKKIIFMTAAGLFPMALYVAIQFRVGINVLNSWILMPGFGIPWVVPGISLADIIFN
jgi:EpsG family